MKFNISALLLGSLLFIVTGCNNSPETQKETAQTKPAKKSLYERIGKQAAVDAAVDLFYVKVLADKRVNHFFDDVNMNKQKKKQKAKSIDN